VVIPKGVMHRPRGESFGAIALGNLASTTAGQIGIMVTAGFAEAWISGQGGLFALLPRSRFEATPQLPQLKVVPPPPAEPITR
jgi:hypothetical protein